MTDENQNRDWLATERDSLDRELDAALAKYAAVEPRTGLEERLLANLRAEREHAPDRAWWRWSVVSAVMLAAVVIVVTLAWKPSTQRAPVIADHPLTATPGVKQPGPGPTVASKGPASGDNSPAPRPTIKPVMHRTHSVAVAEAHPKLDQFPSPQPLSEQEKILQSYVAAYPHEALLIAIDRGEALRRDLEELKVLASGQRPTDSEEQNQDTTRR